MPKVVGLSIIIATAMVRHQKQTEQTERSALDEEQTLFDMDPNSPDGSQGLLSSDISYCDSR
jgi:hypothetical protein